MNTNFYQGKLKRWDDDKGFGFIEQKNGKDIFIHISALKRMTRRPVIGDIIHYQIHTENNGKNRAVNAKIEGVTEYKPTFKKKAKRNKKANELVSAFFTLVFLGAVGLFIYNKLVDHVPKQIFTKTISFPKESVNYSCSGKVYCSEMTSCEEAMFYQNNCPGTKMDGDSDGIPCESQCNW